jgi:predicted DNA-binding protein
MAKTIKIELFKTIITEIAKNEGKTKREIVNNLIKKGIKTMEKPKLEDIVKNNPKLKFIKKSTFKKSRRNFEELIGIVKAPDGFDPVKALNEVRQGKY